jgi:hypothetical protein
MAYSNGEIDALVMSASGDKSKYQDVLDYVMANYDSAEMKTHVESRLPLLNSAFGDKDLAGLAQKYIDAKNNNVTSQGFTTALANDPKVAEFGIKVAAPAAEQPAPPPPPADRRLRKQHRLLQIQLRLIQLRQILHHQKRRLK